MGRDHREDDALNNGAPSSPGGERGSAIQRSTREPPVLDPARLMEDRSGGPVTSVQCGRWTLQVRGDEIADISFAAVMLLRGIRPVIRDRDWNTVPVRVTGVTSSPEGLVTTLTFDDGEIRFEGSIRLTMTGDRLDIHFDATCRQSCDTNRVGLVVLHRPDDAGTAVAVRHTDGSVRHTAWPEDISPHQPFHEVVGFTWTRAGVRAHLALAGDVFETEDQRNWTDASFKTYGTPLSIPFPVSNPVGTTIHQAVSLQAIAPAAGPSPHRVRNADHVSVTETVVGHIPPISLGAALYPPADLHASGDGRYDAVLVELAGDPSRWSGLLDAGVAQADALGCGLDVRIITDLPDVVRQLVAALPVGVTRVGAFDPENHISTEPLWRALVDAASDTGISTLLGGTRAHFTELNRRIHDIPPEVTALTFGLAPQMHATEIPHIIDSLTTQGTVATNAVRLAEGRPLHIGPITLARRFNAVATTGPRPPETDARNATDPLLDTPFAAAWTLGSVSALSRDGVASLCYYETAGPRGLGGARTRKPVGLLLDHLAQWRGQPILRVEAPHDVSALAVRTTSGATEMAVADLSGRPRQVVISRPGLDDRVVSLEPWDLVHLADDEVAS